MLDPTSKLSLVFERHPTSARRARRALQEFLGDDAAIRFTRDAVLLTSELVTNAVTHTERGCRVTASFDRARQWLRVEVADGSSHIPQVQLSTNPLRVGGHGLPLLAKVASRWGATPLAGGKTMWFELDGAVRST